MTALGETPEAPERPRGGQNADLQLSNRVEFLFNIGMGRYDLTDFKRRVIEPLLPNKPRGVPRVDDRRVLNGIFGFCVWEHLGVICPSAMALAQPVTSVTDTMSIEIRNNSKFFVLDGLGIHFDTRKWEA
jgi:hypothetical protein